MTDTTPITQGLPRIAQEAGSRMLAEILRRHREAGEVASGQTSRTLRIEPSADGFQLVGWKYAGTYDEGRKEGRMPPPAAIAAWIRAKGITFDKPGSIEHYAYAIAKKIGEQGTRRYYGKREDVFKTPIADMRRELAEYTTKYLQADIARTLVRAGLNR